MAFVLSDINGYGTGSLGDVTNPAGQFCSYANVVSYTANSITIDTPSNGAYEKFEAGTEILIHVSASVSSTSIDYLGTYIVAKITAVNASTLSINKDFTVSLPTNQAANFVVQAVTIPQFNTLTLSSGNFSPIAYDVTKKYGGILAIKCKNSLVFSGGNILLTDKGIPVANKTLRPITDKEASGTLDADTYSGWENHITVRNMMMNAGDGVFFCAAKTIDNSANTSTTRIGGTTAGVRCCRGAKDSVGLVAGTTNIGGSTIMMVCDNFRLFLPSMISKVRTAADGQGLGRCYIASGTKLANDEGLYAYDCVSDPNFLTQQLNIKDFGSSKHGNVTNPTKPLNNYAHVKAIDSTGKIFFYDNITTDGMADFSAGATVMIHITRFKDESETQYSNKFMFTKVLKNDTAAKTIVLNDSIEKIISLGYIEKYSIQLISVLEAVNATFSKIYDLTTAYNATTQLGGICAIMCSNILDITDVGITVVRKVSSTNSEVTSNSYLYLGNAQNRDVLPLSNENGSIFIAAKTLKSNTASRLGNNWAGTGDTTINAGSKSEKYVSNFGCSIEHYERGEFGAGGSRGAQGSGGSTGYSGAQGGGGGSGALGFPYENHGYTTYSGPGGDGGPGTSFCYYKATVKNGGDAISGQYGHEDTSRRSGNPGKSGGATGCYNCNLNTSNGSNIFIVANTIDMFILDNYSTGGMGGNGGDGGSRGNFGIRMVDVDEHGGTFSYNDVSAGAGKDGLVGASSGHVFFYCNHVNTLFNAGVM